VGRGICVEGKRRAAAAVMKAREGVGGVGVFVRGGVVHGSCCDGRIELKEMTRRGPVLLLFDIGLVFYWCCL
jgi:hypothetical protein